MKARRGVTDNPSTMAVAPAFDPAQTARIGYDVGALERFYRAFYDDVVRYVARRVTDPHDVADLVADTFLAAMGSAASFDSRRGRTLPWLIGIAHNTVRHFDRRRHHQHVAVQRIVGRRLLDADDIADLEERIAAQQRGAQARRLLDQLPPRQRELVELVDIQGLTPTETAQVLGIPAGLARIRLHRARAALRKALDTATDTTSDSTEDQR
jgi:RNA polymerase sigma-70 factor (ECF subfamily)